MPNAKNLEPFTKFKGLWVGRSGSRKTSMAASFPGRKFCYDIDGRIQALRGKDVDYEQFSFDLKGFEKLEKQLDNHLLLSQKGQLPYDLIIFSSLSTLQRLLVFAAIDIVGSREKVQKKEAGHWMGNLMLPGMEEYKYRAEASYDIVYRYLKAFNCNVIVEGHYVDRYDKEGAVIGKKLFGADKLAEEFPINFDETWEFRTEDSLMGGNQKFFVRFRGELAKTTFKELPDQVEIKDTDHFYDNLVKAVLEQKKGE